jgi:hypothetical protein
MIRIIDTDKPERNPWNREGAKAAKEIFEVFN